jgi:hypothetical protein
VVGGRRGSNGEQGRSTGHAREPVRLRQQAKGYDGARRFLDEHDQGRTVEELAGLLGRQPGGIRSGLQRPGRLPDDRLPARPDAVPAKARSTPPAGRPTAWSTTPNRPDGQPWPLRTGDALSGPTSRPQRSLSWNDACPGGTRSGQTDQTLGIAVIQEMIPKARW